MTTFPFTPTAGSVFQFQPTLDGNVYNVSVTWNTFAQRYYINIDDLGGNRIVTLPLIGSPLDYDISMTAGYFTSILIYREPSRQFEVSP